MKLMEQYTVPYGLGIFLISKLLPSDNDVCRGKTETIVQLSTIAQK